MKTFQGWTAGRGAFVTLVCSLLLTACGGGDSHDNVAPGSPSTPTPPTAKYTIGGSVAGLTQGAQLTLDNNGGDALAVTANGVFTFATPIVSNGGYAVTAASQPNGLICTVSNGTGTGVAANVSNVSVLCAATTHTVSGTLSGLSAGSQAQLENNSGDPLTVSANGTFTFATPIADQGSYAVTVNVRPLGEVCSVSNGTGTAVTADVSGVNVTCTAVPGFAYAANFVGSSIGSLSQFSIGSSGALVPMATPSVNTGSTVSVAVDHQGRFAYVAKRGGNTVEFLSIGTADGSLTPITDGTTGLTSVATGTIPQAVAVDPTNKYVYVANQGSGTGSISQYAIASNGALTPLAPPSVVAGNNPISIAVDPTSHYVYVANGASSPNGRVSEFAIGSDGTLTPIAGNASIAAGSFPVSVTIEPTGRYVYAANMFGNSISEYAIGLNGALSPITNGGVPALAVAGPTPNAVVADPTGQYLYGSNNNGINSTVSQYVIDSGTGLLSKVADTPTANGGAFWLAFDPSDQNAYVISGGVFLQFSLGVAGSLIPTGVPVSSGPNPQNIVTTH